MSTENNTATILFSTSSPNREAALEAMGFTSDGLYWNATLNHIPFRIGFSQVLGLTQEGWVKFIADAADAYAAQMNVQDAETVTA